MTDDEEKPKKIYTVGYRRPPKNGQFKPGESGNKKGRPPGRKNFQTIITQELNARVEISENGRRRTISKREAVAKQLVNKAAGGDAKFIPILLNETRQHERLDAHSDTTSIFKSAEDHQVMASILARIRQTVATEPAKEIPIEVAVEEPPADVTLNNEEPK